MNCHLTHDFGAVSRARQQVDVHGGDRMHLCGEVAGKPLQVTRCRDLALAFSFERETLGPTGVTRVDLNVCCHLANSGYTGSNPFGPSLDCEGAPPTLLQCVPR